MSVKSNRPNSILNAFVEHKKLLAAYIARRIIRTEDIDDVIQEAFVQLCEAGERDHVISPKAYLFAVARNILSKQYAQQSKYRLEQLDEASLSGLHSDQDRPDVILYEKMKLKAFLSAVEYLPTQCRRVFFLRKMKGMSHNMISAELGISKSTVERHITLAMTRLRAEMKKGGYADLKTTKSFSAKTRGMSGNE